MRDRPGDRWQGCQSVVLADAFHPDHVVKDKCEVQAVSPSNIHVLHPTRHPRAGYRHVGQTGHHKVESLPPAYRLGFWRLIFDAAFVAGQLDWPPFRGNRPGLGGMSLIQGGRP
jgi:hypothetical protein